MPFQKGNKLGSHRNHARGFACRNKEDLKNQRWMRKGLLVQRVPSEEVDSYIAEGWQRGRGPNSEQARKNQSEAAKKAKNPARWVKGHRTWNTGDKMPESACIAMSIGRLKKYGVTEAEVLLARSENKSWCSHHFRFEPNVSFNIVAKTGRRATRCNECHFKHTALYKEQFSTQKGLCGICEEVEPRLDALSLDHRHDCQNPKHTRKNSPMPGCECSRGLLCSLCNPRLGWFEGFLEAAVNPQFAEGSWEAKALAYLKSYETEQKETLSAA